MKYAEVIAAIKANRNERNIAGMARFGISPKNTYGLPIPLLRQMAKKIGRDHALALRLWKSGIHEARLLAGFIGDPAQVTVKQMDRWAKDFDSWDICDQVCSNLFDRTPFAYRQAFEWSKRKEEFVKRAGYVLMAALAVHDKNAPDAKLAKFFPVIIKGSIDKRNFVRKAVNWALRQIGKRNRHLNKLAVKTGREIAGIDSKAARWIAADALRELTGRTFA